MNKSEPCRISVITPSYNQQQFLEKTLTSVLSQREDIHEYLVFDAKSSDGSQDILERYRPDLDSCVIEEDSGQADALSRGFAAATGNVLCWINSDDFFLPGALRKVRECFERFPNVDVVTGYLILVDEHDKIISMPRVSGGNRLVSQYGHIQVSQQATFFKKSLYESVGRLDSSLQCAMDYDLWARFFLERANWVSLPIHLAAFRKQEAAKSSGNEWWETFQVEKELVRNRYPDLFGSRMQINAARNTERFIRLLSLEFYLSVFETFRYRGVLVTDVFPDNSPQSENIL